MIYPALGWLGPEVLISNEPRDSTINYIQRSAIRQQTGHCKKKKKGPSIFLTFPPVLQKYLRIAQLTYWWTQTNLGKWWGLVVPTWDVRWGGGQLAGVAMIGRWRGRGLERNCYMIWPNVKKSLPGALHPQCPGGPDLLLLCTSDSHPWASNLSDPPSWGG